jgi:hypothetical protein
MKRVVYTKSADLLYTDTTATKLFTLPMGARIIGVKCYTQAASTGATLDVGISSNSDSYIDGLDVAIAQINVGTVLDGDRLTVPTDIYGLIGGTPSSGGPFTVIVEFDTSKSRGLK